MAKVKPQVYVDNIPAAGQDVILPTLKPSGTAPSNYGAYINTPTSPTYISSVAASTTENFADKAKSEELLRKQISYKNNLTRGNESGNKDLTLQPSTDVADKLLNTTYQNNLNGTPEIVTAPDTASAPVDSYLNFLNGQTAYLDAAYKAEKDRIDEETRGLLAQIETKRQRAVVDADSAYELNKATHGTQAERLASMGLTGSGYSDHLESRAYAASRGEVQAANASALDATNEVNVNATNQKLAAGVTYQNGLRESEAQRAAYIESKFDSLNAGAATGVYSQEQLNAYADYYGFDNSKRDVLSSSANAFAEQKMETEKEKEGTYYTNYMTMRDDVLANPSAYSDEVIDKGVGITYSEKEAAALKNDRDAEISRLAIETIDTDITSGNYASAYEAADVAYENKFIDAPTYQSKNFEIVLTKCKSATTADDVLALEAELENLRKAGKISGADKTAGLQYLYANVGNVLNQDKYQFNSGGDLSYASIDLGGVHYDTNIRLGKMFLPDAKTSNALTSIAGNKLQHGTLVEFDGRLYVWIDKKHWTESFTGWGKINNTKLYEAYMKQCSYQPKPTVPKHTA